MVSSAFTHPNETRVTRILLILGWLLVGLDLIAAATLLFGRKGGDAATSAIGPGFGSLLLILGVVAAALLLWGGRGAGKPIVLVIAGVLAIAPVALTLVFLAPSERMRGWIYPSMRDDRPRLPSPQYAYPDAASREAALALVMQDYAKLDTLLRATRAPDLTARDELGQSLTGLATSVASMEGGTMRDVEGLRLLLAAGARPRAGDMGTGRDKSLMELLALSKGERGRTVLEMLLAAGLSADTPTSDGRSVLFDKYLSADAARVLLAHGANKTPRKTTADVDWSPVTEHAEMQNWATALALLEGGVPRDYGTPIGSVLARVLKESAYRLTDDDRANASFKTLMALVQP